MTAPAEPRVTIETIDAHTARHYMGQNKANRRIRQNRVCDICRDILAGRWIFDGNPIAFDADGNLVAGQHRLSALLLAAETDPSVTITTTVVRGVAKETVLTSNSGVPTSLGDVLTIDGHASANALAAAARLLHAYENGGLSHSMSNVSNMPGGGRMTAQELLTFVNRKHATLIDSVTEARRHRERGDLAGPPAAWALAHYILSGIDPDDARDFLDRASYQILRGPEDPVAVMVKRLNRERAVSRNILPATALYIIFRCWNAYRQNMPVQKLLLGSAPRKGENGTTGGWKAIPTPI